MNDEDIRNKLNPTQYAIMREGKTEMPYTGRFLDDGENGVYYCALCENILFTSLSKIESKDGLPCFSDMFNDKSLEFVKENDGSRTEARCASCKSHHGFLIGAIDDDTHYFQVNSIALGFKEIKIETEDEKKGEEKRDTNNSSNSTMTISSVALTAGGVLVGAVIGGALVYFTVPAPACNLPTNSQAISTSSPTSASNSSATPTGQTPTSASSASTPRNTPQTPTTSPASSSANPSQGVQSMPPNTGTEVTPPPQASDGTI